MPLEAGSHIAFYSDALLFLIHLVFTKIADVVSREVNDNFGKLIPYQATGVGLNYDLTTVALGPAPFNIQGRDGASFSENKYFSVAPVRTKVLLELLDMVETAARAKI